MDSLREVLEAKTEELQQLTASVKQSLESQVESNQKIQLATLVLAAEHLICCAEFNKLLAEPQPDLQPLLEKVSLLSKEVETLKKEAGKFSGQLGDLVGSLQDLTSDLVALGGLTSLPEEILLKIISYLDPASVKAVSLVSR